MEILHIDFSYKNLTHDQEVIECDQISCKFV